MAQKKITDLSLRSDFDETCNIPVDDSAQTWRVTGEQVKDFMIGAIPKPTIQKFTSGSGTYTKPSGVKWIRVRMVGGGGASSCATSTANQNTNNGAGGNGGDTTFGTSLLVAEGGKGADSPLGSGAGSLGGEGGDADLGTGPIGIALKGAWGQGNNLTFIADLGGAGGSGGGTPFGGGGGGGGWGSPGGAGQANTGAGGGAGGWYAGGAGADGFTGSGGGGGGYVDAIIQTPASTYPYSVGAGGVGVTGVHSGQGADGGSGVIIVEEHYV